MPHVLLYYCYADLRRTRAEVAEWIELLCLRLELQGRIRVAFDGLNVTVRVQDEGR
jgi:predicted sulfurtransferase